MMVRLFFFFLTKPTSTNVIFFLPGKCGAMDLGKAERFCMALLRIPRYQERIRCFMYVMRFQEMIKDLEQDFNTITSACNRVLTSKALINALKVLVALGNFLNLYSVNGEAEGVTIDSLNKLKQVKSYGSQTTALHYFTLVVQDRSRDIFNLSTEVGDCRGASTCVLSQLSAELKILRKGYLQLVKENECTEKSIGADNNTSNTTTNRKEISEMEESEMNTMFHKSLSSFLISSNKLITTIETMEKNVINKFNEVKLFYGEFDETQPETFFSSLANFVVDFEKARKDNEESRARSKKKKQNKLKQDQRAREMALKKKARKTQQIERRSNHHTISRRGSINVMKPPRAANTPPALKSTYFTL